MAAPFASVWQFVALLLVSNLLFGGARLTLSLKALEMGASAIGVGTVIGAIMLVPALASQSIGRWVDRDGNRAPCVAGAMLLLAGTALAAAAGSLALLAGASVLTGLGYMLMSISTNNAIGATASDATRTRVYGHVAIAFSAGAMLGPFIFGHLIDQLGITSTFWVAATGALACGAWRGALREPPPAAPTMARPGAPRFELLTNRRLKPVYIMNALSSLSWDLFVFLFPLIGVGARLSAGQIGTVISSFAAGGLLSRIMLPALSRRWTEWALLRLSLAVSAAGYTLLIFAHGYAAYAAVACVTGVAAGLGLPLVLSLIYGAAPPGRTGEAMGIRAAITCFGQVAMPAAFGAIGATPLGFTFVLASAAGLMAAGLLVQSPATDPQKRTPP